MKKLNYIKTILLGLAVTASLSSCLKDKTYIDFSQGGVSAELPLSGLNSFSADAITVDTAIVSFGVNIASSKTPTTDSKITVDVIPAKIAEYLKSNPAVQYELMPTTAYTFKTTVVDIPAGQRLKILTFTVYKNKLDPSKSYMLPIGITSAPGLTISANNALHYYHVIGNDFAGVYKWDYTRYNASAPLATPSGGSFTNGTVTISPVSPTQFEVVTGYNTKEVKYEVTFKRNVDGTGKVTYSDFAVSMDPATVKSVWTAGGVTQTQPPKIVSIDPVAKTFIFQYIANNGTADRYIIDKYYK
ncbi:DUF1735 domain-containing protein [Mucilaginibacter sp.]|uniref:DUF1735 domain-containing protein n=1 Tax=Mucilaginibacter sp. TaxID=1882438 RepID=UPI002ED5996E